MHDPRPPSAPGMALIRLAKTFQRRGKPPVHAVAGIGDAGGRTCRPHDIAAAWVLRENSVLSGNYVKAGYDDIECLCPILHRATPGA